MKAQVNYDFTGFSVLITGAASGMGEAAAYRFAKAGASVMLADWNKEQLETLCSKLKKEEYDVTSIVCDVSDEKQVQAMIDKVVKSFGKLDAAYNNAGIMCPLQDTKETETGDFDHTLQVNLKGIWLCMKYELMQMTQQECGSIVNVSSIAGIVGVPGRSPYVAAKHGIIGLTQTAALEYAAKGIRINAVCPGTISTPMVDEMIRTGSLIEKETLNITPMKHFGSTDDIASAVLWLCSSEASYVTGQALAVDGGYLAM